jgi:hypothetical protein
MQPHRTAAAPSPGSSAFRVQRAVLLELLVDPPAAGDPIAELPRRLDAPPADVVAAVTALVAAGAAETRDGFVRASPSARYVAALGLVGA